VGVVPKSIWENTTKALRDALKKCQTNICECLADFIKSQLEGGDGMIDRWDNMTNQFASRDKLDGHWAQFEGRQRQVQKAKDLYNNSGCGGGAHALHPRMDEFLDKTKEDTFSAYQQRWGTAMPQQAASDSVWDWEYWKRVTGLTGGALVLYLIVSEGSRLYPPRNLVPVP
jgi:hypothetical protein